MQLSIIIVNYNVKYFLEQCLFSVVKATKGIEAEIFVVDNASTDGSKAYLESAFPQIQFVWNKDNVGFAKANNQALASAKGDLVLFLNPDTIVPEDCFVKCIQFIHQHPDAGAIGVRMLDGSGTFLPESKRGFPSAAASFYRLSGLSQLFPHSKIFSKYHLGYLNEYENHEVDVLSGAFMMIRKEVLEQTGGFDETFFMYAEDIDLSYRIQQTLNKATGNKYKNFYFSQTTILHFKGESTQKNSVKYVTMFYKAMMQFVQKYPKEFHSRSFTLLISFGIFLSRMLSALKRWVPRQTPESSKQRKMLIYGTAENSSTIHSIIGHLSIQQFEPTASKDADGISLWEFVKERGISELVLCENQQVSFSQIISLFSRMGSHSLQLYVHAGGSRSMVGSGSKHTNGIVMAKDRIPLL